MEPGIHAPQCDGGRFLPGGSGWEFGNTPPISRIGSGRQDAALYGSQDGCRYILEPDHPMPIDSRNSMLLLFFFNLLSSSSIASTGGTPVNARRRITTRLHSSG